MKTYITPYLNPVNLKFVCFNNQFQLDDAASLLIIFTRFSVKTTSYMYIEFHDIAVYLPNFLAIM